MRFQSLTKLVVATGTQAHAPSTAHAARIYIYAQINFFVINKKIKKGIFYNTKEK